MRARNQGAAALAAVASAFLLTPGAAGGDGAAGSPGGARAGKAAAGADDRNRHGRSAELRILDVHPRFRPSFHFARVKREKPGFLVAEVRGRGLVTLMTRRGGGREIRLSPRTQFGSPLTLLVAATRGRWAGVVSSAVPDGRLAWIDRRSSRLRIRRTTLSLKVTLSKRRLELLRAGRAVARTTVAVGAQQSPTPVGRFAVTDKLPGARFHDTYGCCILALSGSQTKLPPGWRGGRRLAIHGTNAPGRLGGANSAGCVAAANEQMERLVRRVPLGAPVSIRP